MKIIGFDEVGRGCLCGPVTAACVLFTPFTNFRDTALADSKALSPQQREKLTSIIREQCVWGLGWVYPHEIDAINIHYASLLAMQRSFDSMLSQYAVQSNLCPPSADNMHLSTSFYPSEDLLALVDGKFCPELALNNKPINSKAIIKGDSKIEEIKAASILAKTARDAHMRLIDQAFPQYGIVNNKGYPTPFHKKAIILHGINSSYRKSFKIAYN